MAGTDRRWKVIIILVTLSLQILAHRCCSYDSGRYIGVNLQTKYSRQIRRIIGIPLQVTHRFKDLLCIKHSSNPVVINVTTYVTRSAKRGLKAFPNS